MEQTEQQKPVTSISIAGETYRHSMIYWGIIAIVVVLFLVTTINYWSGTVKVLEDSTKMVEVKRVPKTP